MFGPQPGEVGGEAFVEPDVLPLLQADTVAKPLVDKFVRHHLFARHQQMTLRQQRPRLCFQRKAQRQHNRAVTFKGIRPNQLAVEFDHLACVFQRKQGYVPCAGGDEVEDGQPVGAFLFFDDVLVNGDGGQVGRHGVDYVPHVSALTIRLDDLDE